MEQVFLKRLTELVPITVELFVSDKTTTPTVEDPEVSMQNRKNQVLPILSDFKK